MIRGFVLATVGLVFSCAVVDGQSSARREFPSATPSYQGTTANAPIDVRFHVKNEGGSDGAGLCVIASILANGRYQAVPSLVDGKSSALWRGAKSRPGGYAPDKLSALLREAVPGEPWASYVGTDTTVLSKLSALGYPIGATMNTGELYGWAPIHHMVSLIHYSSGLFACVVDNNQPGVYSWMKATEFDRRFVDGKVGWAFVWTRLPRRVGASASSVPWFWASTGLVAAVVWVKRYR